MWRNHINKYFLAKILVSTKLLGPIHETGFSILGFSTILCLKFRAQSQIWNLYNCTVRVESKYYRCETKVNKTHLNEDLLGEQKCVEFVVYNRIKLIENRIYREELKESLDMNFFSPFQPEREFKVYKSCKCSQMAVLHFFLVLFSMVSL